MKISEEIKEEIIEMETIQIALDDKIHRMMSDFQKIRKIHNSLDHRLKALHERTNNRKTHKC